MVMMMHKRIESKLAKANDDFDALLGVITTSKHDNTMRNKKALAEN